MMYECKVTVSRLNLSTLSGHDLLDGNFTSRSPAEMQRFFQIVGKDPMLLPRENVGNRLPQKIADYDALREHYSSSRDMFITLDKRDYFLKEKRNLYEKELGLLIKTPDEFMSEYGEFDA